MLRVRAGASIDRPPAGDIYRRDALNAPLCANDGGDVAAINLDPAPVRASRKRIERIVFGRGRSHVSACQKSFDKLAEGRASSLTTAAPTSFFAEIFQISGRKNCKGTIFALENGIFRRFQSSRACEGKPQTD